MGQIPLAESRRYLLLHVPLFIQAREVLFRDLPAQDGVQGIQLPGDIKRFGDCPLIVLPQMLRHEIGSLLLDNRTGHRLQPACHDL
ncbi:hypothetical protein B0H50_1531 [Hallerella porci]|uniref:Uncharacterized protein n=1 Tax=Hallerella porci TaxID=1945871 RepID=A0ABX5LH69_9BACT|nr:hypothetical protein B0H50_1531 [Hallerella porci]